MNRCGTGERVSTAPTLTHVYAAFFLVPPKTAANNKPPPSSSNIPPLSSVLPVLIDGIPSELTDVGKGGKPAAARCNCVCTIWFCTFCCSTVKYALLPADTTAAIAFAVDEDAGPEFAAVLVSTATGVYVAPYVQVSVFV